MSENNIQIDSIDDAKDEIQRFREFVHSTIDRLAEVERVSMYRFDYEARLSEVKQDAEDVKDAVKDNLAEFEQYECENPREMKPLQHKYKNLAQKLNRKIRTAEDLKTEFPDREEFETTRAMEASEQQIKFRA